MNKTLSLIFGLALVSVSASAALITNGDFEAGNTGFTTNYTFVAAPGPNALNPEGTYTVTSAGQTSNSFHSFWTPGVSPLGGNSMMLLNGLTGSGDEWAGTATGLISGVSYTVKGWGVSVFAANPANLQWFIGAGSIGASVVLPGTVGAPWTAFNGTFVASGTTQALIIRSTQTARDGNDFALDSLTITETVPEPGTYALFAFGLVGIAAIRRRK